MSASQQLVDSYVNRAVAEFKENPLCTKLLRRLAEELPEQFILAAARHLDQEEDSEALRLLTLLMLRQRELFGFLANPGFGSRDRAIRIVRRMMKFDPSFDVRLARSLPDRGGLNHHEAFTGARAFRIMDILDEVSRGRRLLPVLSHLVSSDDEKLSARATIFVGRRVQSAEWAAKQLKHHDQRVRASAIESIWGLRGPAAAALLESAAEDPNNRVAGNAILGLHLIEAPCAGDIIQRMAEHSAPNFRSTAAWVMGRIASPDFIPLLNRLLKDEHPMVRSTALRALIEVRRFESHSLGAIASRAMKISEEEAAERLAAATEILETGRHAPRERSVAPAPVTLRLDGSSFAFRGR